MIDDPTHYRPIQYLVDVKGLDFVQGFDYCKNIFKRCAASHEQPVLQFTFSEKVPIPFIEKNLFGQVLDVKFKTRAIDSIIDYCKSNYEEFEVSYFNGELLWGTECFPYSMSLTKRQRSKTTIWLCLPNEYWKNEELYKVIFDSLSRFLNALDIKSNNPKINAIDSIVHTFLDFIVVDYVKPEIPKFTASYNDIPVTITSNSIQGTHLTSIAFSIDGIDIQSLYEIHRVLIGVFPNSNDLFNFHCKLKAEHIKNVLHIPHESYAIEGELICGLTETRIKNILKYLSIDSKSVSNITWENVKYLKKGDKQDRLIYYLNSDKDDTKPTMNLIVVWIESHYPEDLNKQIENAIRTKLLYYGSDEY